MLCATSGLNISSFNPFAGIRNGWSGGDGKVAVDGH
jgi:hypothetical protein